MQRTQGRAKVIVEVSAVSGPGFFSKGKVVLHTSAYVSIRQHTPAYDSMQSFFSKGKVVLQAKNELRRMLTYADVG